MTLHNLTTEDMAQASPSALDAYNEDVQKAVKILEKEAENTEGMDSELLDAASKYLRHEVLNR